MSILDNTFWIQLEYIIIFVLTQTFEIETHQIIFTIIKCVPTHTMRLWCLFLNPNLDGGRCGGMLITPAVWKTCSSTVNFNFYDPKTLWQFFFRISVAKATLQLQMSICLSIRWLVWRYLCLIFNFPSKIPSCRSSWCNQNLINVLDSLKPGIVLNKVKTALIWFIWCIWCIVEL